MSSSQNQQQNQNNDKQKIPQNHTIIKILNYLQQKNIAINNFWLTNRNYVSIQDLQKFCIFYGLKLTINQVINLKNQLFVQKNIISLQQFCEFVPEWYSKKKDIIQQFLKHRSDLLIQTLNIKHKSQFSKTTHKSPLHSHPLCRPKSGTTYPSTQPSAKPRISSYDKLKKPCSNFKNNSKKYLQLNRLKNLKKQQQLAQTIQKTKNQHQYNMLIKMSQLNQFNHKNKLPLTYRAYKNAQGIIKVRTFDLQNFKKQLSIQQFQSQYKTFKKSTKQNKQWQRPISIKLASSNNIQSKITSITTINKNQKKQDRQKQLKNLLQNTIQLTKLLQNQIKILKMKGICASDHP